ncbi:MAG: LptA/OstA family protein, partial [Elusimicrobiota bacterium]
MPQAPAEPHLDFVADSLDYDRAGAEIHLKGNVRIQESTWTLKGDELWIDTTKRRARSEGYLLLEDGVSALHGNAGDFDFYEHSGVLYNASAGHGDWRVHARSMVIDPKRNVDYTGADFTSCSFDPKPHYHFHASRVSVAPRRRLFARNVVFFVGKVPVFYLPFLYKSLKTAHFLRFRLQPGYDRRNGAFMKSTLTNQHGLYWRSKLFLDYYSAQGFGAGGELHRRDGLDSRGVLGGYRIKETPNGQQRWSVTGDLYQGFASSFSLQGRLQVMSDADFNNNYARSSPFRVTPDLLNSGAVVYRLPQVTTRLSYSRQ